MACGSCGTSAGETVYIWTSDDGTDTQSYPTLIQAKAKVMRKGGSYVSITPGPTG